MLYLWENTVEVVMVHQGMRIHQGMALHCGHKHALSSPNTAAPTPTKSAIDATAPSDVAMFMRICGVQAERDFMPHTANLPAVQLWLRTGGESEASNDTEARKSCQPHPHPHHLGMYYAPQRITPSPSGLVSSAALGTFSPQVGHACFSSTYCSKSSVWNMCQQDVHADTEISDSTL